VVKNVTSYLGSGRILRDVGAGEFYFYSIILLLEISGS
jgi:hypothetical protein